MSRRAKHAGYRRNIQYDGASAPPASLKAASAVWRLFHKKSEPHELIDINAPWPEHWEYAGEALTTYYRSSKWNDDDSFERYFHEHTEDGEGRIGIWHPAGLFPWTAASPQPPKFAYPKAVAVLGFSLGVDVRRHDTGEQQKAITEKGAFLVAAPDRKNLWIVEPSGGVVAMIAGPGLSVEARGIVG